ncbi:MAG: diguanylate cyclase [Nitrospirae bacterium]|nr:diguanylate cyclase [Nitrospirota bacterium]
MSILIIDDSRDIINITETFLKNAGYKDLVSCSSAEEAMTFVGLSENLSPNNDIELILMDIMMPGINGIELTMTIKNHEAFKDIPIIMLTANETVQDLQNSFAVGAMDYIKKPFKKEELLARVSSALRLKHEMDQRKAREKELLETMQQLETANKMLQTLSAIDSLTNIANRRFLDHYLYEEWRRAVRNEASLSIIMADIDHFKLYNDTHGHQAGDEVIKKVAAVLKAAVHRPGDLVARYGGEEFIVVLQDTGKEGGMQLAEKMRQNIFSLSIPHDKSSYGLVSLSLGVSSVVPTMESSTEKLINEADKALYKAKEKGRNRAEYYDGKG